MLEKRNEIISVIVPVYNVKDYLIPCVESLIAQTYRHIEILLVDDGSTDGSGVLCDNLSQKDNRINVFHKRNGGLSDARNYGLKVAKGQFIGFVDSDDWVSADMYQILLDNLLKANADISVCEKIIAYDTFQEDCGKTKTCCTLSTQDALTVLYRNEKYMSHSCNKLFKRSLFSNIEFPKGKYFEDYFIMHELFGKAQTVTFCDMGLYYYRQRQGSITNSKNADSWKDFIDAIIVRMQSKYTTGREDIMRQQLFNAAYKIKTEICAGERSAELVELEHYVNSSLKHTITLKNGLRNYTKFLLLRKNYRIYSVVKKIKKTYFE